MKKQVLGSMSAFLLMTSTLAFAAPAPLTVGVMTSSGTLNCAKTTDGRCIWASKNPSGYDTKGSTTHDLLSGSSTAIDARGTAIASAEADLTSYLPTLHAYASSNGSWAPDFSALAGKVWRAGPPAIYYTGQGAAIADANAFAVQGYQYTGASAFELTITGTLDSIFSANGMLGKTGHSGFSLSIFDTQGYLFNPDWYSPTSAATTCPILGNPANICPAGGPAVYDSDKGFLYDTGTISLTISHIVNPGDKFFVGAFLDADVCCGGTVDSSHTLKLRFNDFTQLDSIAVPGVIPEPKSLLLLLAGLVLMPVGLRRMPRRRLQRPYQ